MTRTVHVRVSRVGSSSSAAKYQIKKGHVLLNTLLTHTARNSCAVNPSGFTQSHSWQVLSNTYSPLTESSWNCNNTAHPCFGSNKDLKIIVQGQGIYLFIFMVIIQMRSLSLNQSPLGRKHIHLTLATLLRDCSSSEESDIRNNSLKSHMAATESNMESGVRFCLHTCFPTIKFLLHRNVIRCALLYLAKYKNRHIPAQMIHTFFW